MCIYITTYVSYRLSVSRERKLSLVSKFRACASRTIKKNLSIPSLECKGEGAGEEGFERETMEISNSVSRGVITEFRDEELSPLPKGSKRFEDKGVEESTLGSGSLEVEIVLLFLTRKSGTKRSVGLLHVRRS